MLSGLTVTFEKLHVWLLKIVAVFLYNWHLKNTVFSFLHNCTLIFIMSLYCLPLWISAVTLLTHIIVWIFNATYALRVSLPFLYIWLMYMLNSCQIFVEKTFTIIESIICFRRIYGISLYTDYFMLTFKIW